MKLEQAKEGRKVVYKPWPSCPPHMYEEGIITSKNDKFVFVRYGNNVNSKSTRAEDLEYA